MWGAGAKGVAFLNMVDPEKRYVSKVIDINPKKQGTFLPGSGHEIVSPEYLKEVSGSIIVVVMNENYLEEIKECVSKLRIEDVSYMTLHK